MAKKYNLTTWEMLDYLHQFEECDFTEPFTGFSEQEITAVEQKYHITFPPFYKEYMTYCGNHPINDIFNHINKPSEIMTNYEFLEEDIEDYAKDLQDMTKEEIDEACAEHEIYRLCQLPRDQWHTVTQEYVLTWYENQGCWNAGYLRRDLEQGIPNPPMYITTNDDFITFEKTADDTASFLNSIFFMASYEIGNGYDVSKHDDIIETLKNADIDLSITEKDGVNTCLDTDTNILYFCWVNQEKNFLQLMIINEPYDDEDEE